MSFLIRSQGEDVNAGAAHRQRPENNLEATLWIGFSNLVDMIGEIPQALADPAPMPSTVEPALASAEQMAQERAIVESNLRIEPNTAAALLSGEPRDGARRASESKIPASAPSVPSDRAVVGGARPRRYRIRLPDGGERLEDREQILRSIRGGNLPPDALVCGEGTTRWRKASDWPDLGDAFQPRALRARPLRRGEALAACVGHPTRKALWHCGGCATPYCPACVRTQAGEDGLVSFCPRCEQACEPASYERVAAPFWREIPRVLLYPLVGWGPVMVALCGLLAWSGAQGGILSKLAGGFLILVYCVEVIKDSAAGSTRPPTWTALLSSRGSLGRAARVLACLAISFFPLVVLLVSARPVFPPELSLERFGSDTLAFIATVPAVLFSAVYFPMVLLSACISDTFRPALNPVLVLRTIARIPGEYTVVIAFCLALSALRGIVQWPTTDFPLVNEAGSAAVGVYVLFVDLHVLGRMAHRCECRLNWNMAL